MIYSASSVIAADRFSDSFYFVKRQAVFFTLGCGLMLITKKISYQMYKKRAPLLFFIHSLTCSCFNTWNWTGEGWSEKLDWACEL